MQAYNLWTYYKLVVKTSVFLFYRQNKSGYFNKASSLIHNHIYVLIIQYLVQQLTSILVYYVLLPVLLLKQRNNFALNQLKLCIH